MEQSFLKFLITIKTYIFLPILLIYYFVNRKKTKNPHENKLLMSNEENFSNDFIQNIMFSEYAKNLESLRNHVVGLKVLDSIVGNRGFILKLENDKWAAAFRKDNSILHDFSNEKISNEILEIINSTDY